MNNKTAGTYVYDKEKGRMIKVSDEIPGVSSKKRKSRQDVGPCGKPACGGGGCARG